MDCLRKEIEHAIEKQFKDLGENIADPTTGQKGYWNILNEFIK